MMFMPACFGHPQNIDRLPLFPQITMHNALPEGTGLFAMEKSQIISWKELWT
jgi:hypothetical protein